MKRITVVGAMGRMGQSIIRLLSQDKELQGWYGIENAEHDAIGKDLGLLNGLDMLGREITADRDLAFKDTDAIIDFSSPKSTMETVDYANKYQKPVVIGTTGFSDEQVKKIQASSDRIALLMAPNMSLGVNLLFKIAEQTTKALRDKDFDIEIVELHHRYKKDSPSGTAAKLSEIIASANGTETDDIIYGRQGNSYPERKRKEIAVHAVRGGDIVGEHTAYFTALGERIELTHRAHSRDTFASGAIAAAKFLLSVKAGFYTMNDVLGL